MTITGATARTITLTAVAVLALLLAYLIGARDEARPTPVAPVAAGTATSDLGTITMTGSGEVVAVPDQMTFKVAVTKLAPDVAKAMDQASRTMGRVLAALDRAGVERKDTESTGLSVNPEYRYVSYAPPQLTGYRVRQSMSVLVTELRDGGRAIADAVAAGGNAVRVSGIGLRIGDQDALLAEARSQAVEDATAKAQQYAEATGQPLGQVLTVREGSQPGRTVRPQADLVRGYASADKAAELRSVPIRAGSRDLEIKVTVVWALDG